MFARLERIKQVLVPDGSWPLFRAYSEASFADRNRATAERLLRDNLSLGQRNTVGSLLRSLIIINNEAKGIGLRYGLEVSDGSVKKDGVVIPGVNLGIINNAPKGIMRKEDDPNPPPPTRREEARALLIKRLAEIYGEDPGLYAIQGQITGAFKKASAGEKAREWVTIELPIEKSAQLRLARVGSSDSEILVCIPSPYHDDRIPLELITRGGTDRMGLLNPEEVVFPIG